MNYAQALEEAKRQALHHNIAIYITRYYSGYSVWIATDYQIVCTVHPNGVCIKHLGPEIRMI
jgi:hypothetical protein